MLPPLLFLCHRIPFPPNKGDKITTFNLLKFLSTRYSVYLGCFIDDINDFQYQDDVRQFCQEAFFVSIQNKKMAISGINALLKRNSVSNTFYENTEMQDWVDNVIVEKQIDKLFIYSASMAQFVDSPNYKHKVRILDMADVDSDKWRQFAIKKPWYSAWIYQREYKIMANYEQFVCEEFDACTLISDSEAELFRTLVKPVQQSKVYTLTNGVDTDYFNPNATFDLTDLPSLKQGSICFTGAMDYWANEDAVVWFHEKVWPAIKAKNPDCIFYIVGGKPTANVKALTKDPSVVVTGRVPDVRPYIDASALAVAPMRIARGIQNKVIEAMAMAKPVVMTSMGQEGIDVSSQPDEYIQNNPENMAKVINNILTQSEHDFSANREWIIKNFGWAGALKKLPSLLEIKKELVQ